MQTWEPLPRAASMRRLLVTSYSATIPIRCQDEIFTAQRGRVAPLLWRKRGQLAPIAGKPRDRNFPPS